jgi:hypothetical protein
MTGVESKLFSASQIKGKAIADPAFCFFPLDIILPFARCGLLLSGQITVSGIPHPYLSGFEW